MGTEVATQEIPRVVDNHSGVTPRPLSLDELYAQALARLGEIGIHWKEALDNLGKAERLPEAAECSTSWAVASPDEEGGGASPASDSPEPQPAASRTRPSVLQRIRSLAQPTTGPSQP
jgi:hypothetical protein